MLEAYFIAVLQVLVYAGAVMVLFLFIIMLLNVEKGEGGGYAKDRISLAASIVGFALVAVLVAAAFGGEHLPEPGLVEMSRTFRRKGFEFSTAGKSLATASFQNTCCPFRSPGFCLPG